MTSKKIIFQIQRERELFFSRTKVKKALRETSCVRASCCVQCDKQLEAEVHRFEENGKDNERQSSKLLCNRICILYMGM